MKIVIACAAVLACIGGPARMTAPEIPAARRLAAYIPVTAGPWLSEADQVFDSATVFDYIDGAGEVYRSYKMEILVARRFHKDGRPDIVVDAFDMGSSGDAFGVFTHDLDGEDAGIGQGSRYKAGLLSFWKDRYFLSVYAEEETAETRGLVLQLGRAIAAAIPGEGKPPDIVRILPADGAGPRRARFFHSHAVLNYHFFVAAANVLRLDAGTDAALAEYGGADGRSRLLVVAYPGEAAAAGAAASFAEAYMPEAEGRTAVETENGRWTAFRVDGRHLAVVFDAATEKEAEARLEAVSALVRDRRGGPEARSSD